MITLTYISTDEAYDPLPSGDVFFRSKFKMSYEDIDLDYRFSPHRLCDTLRRNKSKEVFISVPLEYHPNRTSNIIMTNTRRHVKILPKGRLAGLLEMTVYEKLAQPRTLTATTFRNPDFLNQVKADLKRVLESREKIYEEDA